MGCDDIIYFQQYKRSLPWLFRIFIFFYLYIFGSQNHQNEKLLNIWASIENPNLNPLQLSRFWYWQNKKDEFSFIFN